MRRHAFLAIFLVLAVVLPLTAASADAAFKEEIEKLVRQAIEEIPLDAGDLVAALGLRCSRLGGLVKIDLNLRPISLKKRASKVELVNLTTIRASAAFEFLGHYELLVNQRKAKENDVKLVGEGGVNVSFKGLKVRIDDIPSLVLKLADREGECPDVGRITRDPGEVRPGETYRVGTSIKSNSSGHIAYFVFANNKVAQSPDPTLRTVLGSATYAYEAPLAVREDAVPDNYFGNVMAIEIIAKGSNPLDLKAYDALFSTGITMIKVR